MICENCHKNEGISFYHKQNVCKECFEEMWKEDKRKRRLLLKKRGRK